MMLVRRLAAVAAVTLVGCSDSINPPDGPQEADFEWGAELAQGKRLEIKGVMGDIGAAGIPGREYQVIAVKLGQDSDVSSVEIEVVDHADGVTICAVYPDVPGQAPNQCLPGDQGSMNVQNNDVEVTFTVRVPSGVVFVGTNVIGNVEAISVEGDAFLTAVTGNVEVSTTGIAEATTVTGSITAAIGLANWGRDLAFTTVTGNVSVQVPATTNAQVEASTGSGTIVSDFPLTETSPGNKEGPLGVGGPVLSLTTVTGDIHLRSGNLR